MNWLFKVKKSFSDFGRSKGVKVRSVYGGSSIEKQIKALKSGAHIVVGTPGRLLDLIKRKALKLQDIETLILMKQTNA